MSNRSLVSRASHPERFAATDSCVMCGLCLPHCPTFVETRHEAESPRGRIALIQALARGELVADPHLVSHLNSCLVCRACEDMCPSRVPYARLIEAARAELFARNPRQAMPLTSWFMRRFTRSRNFRRLVYTGLNLWQRCAGRHIPTPMDGQHLKGLRRLHSFIPSLQKTPLIGMENHFSGTDTKVVQLFTGCAGEVFARETLANARAILERLGFHVYVPHGQTCCGALPLHAGNESGARLLIRQNIQAFRPDLPIISIASGCTATLKDAGSWYGSDAAALSRVSEDICSFLARMGGPSLPLRRASLRIAVHTPCTLQHVLHADSSVSQLLACIPGVELFELTSNNHCCGAAGRYMFDNPTMADTLVSDKISALHDKKPDLLISSNIGCTLHIQAAMRRAGLSLEVLHPVDLLARQLLPLAASKPVA